MKKIFGIDLGPNSIGGAVINIPDSINDYGKEGNIEWSDSRIIPMDDFVSTKTGKPFKENPADSFIKGVGISKNASRRIKRSSRRLKQRYILRRTRLIKVFKILGWLPEGFPENFKEEFKNRENFKFHISDFLSISEDSKKEALDFLGVKNSKGEIKMPEDWIVYYLRKKGLVHKLSFVELARISYMMNQRRGFKSSRKDLKDDNVEEKKWVEILKIKSVEQETFEPNKNKNFKFKVTPYSERVKPWTVEKKRKPEWEEKEFTFLITDKFEKQKDGTLKFVKQLVPQIPEEDNWNLCVTALDNKIGEEFPGTYFFNGLVESVKNKTDFKIRQYAVYRKKYKAELEAIWQKQIELNEELKRINSDKEILKKIAAVLYPAQTLQNKPKLAEILSHDLLHLISDDLIYYQRDLKSQKNSKSECKYEKRKGVDGNYYGLKCAPKSSPEFQEFRIWQDIHNIKVLQRNGIEMKTLKNGEAKEFNVIDIDVTANYIDDAVKEKLFDLFDEYKEVSQKQIFEVINFENPNNKINDSTHRINMFFGGKDTLVGNETKEYFRRIFKEVNYETEGERILSDRQKFYCLWHIAYSISLNDEEKSKKAIIKALSKANNKCGKTKKVVFDFPQELAEAIANAPEIESTKKYASYSSKAINKLLPLMRCSKYWDENLVELQIKEKADRIKERLAAIDYDARKVKNIADDEIPQQILTSFVNQKDYLSGLKTFQACYLVYERHSERESYEKYSSPHEFDIMKLLPNNSLKNPVVEQVVREAMFVVKDLWKRYGQPDEIHIEMGRELKKNAKEREKASKISTDNATEKKRIKELLKELMNDEFEQYISEGDSVKKENARFETKPNPESPVDINKFRLWKDTSGLNDVDFAKKVKEEKIPKNQEIKKYALWLSQKCISPYTGKIIPLSKLYTDEYEVEHILPKGLIKYDGNENLVIAESGVNKAKSRELGAIFIANHKGKCTYGNREYALLDYDSYVAHCKSTFRGKKLKNLLATEIPQDFISRQLNDTRYISQKISELLYPVAKGKPNAATNAEKGGVVFTSGVITSELKNNWGLNKEWKRLMKPRFERLEKLNNEKYIFENQSDRNDIDFNVKENEDLNIKRIDHRHHALDAIIIAATTIEHIRYLNSLSAVDNDEELKEVKRALVKGKIRDFQLPWENFTKDVKEQLQQMVITYKRNNQILSKPVNHYQKWVLKGGEWKKQEVKQVANPKWFAVRQSLFKEPQGIIYIKEIELKSFRTVNEILFIVKLQIERNEAQNTPAQKTTSYIYDQETREIVKQIIELSGGDMEQIEKYLKKYLKTNKSLKDINNTPIYTVRIAVFKPYAAKRVKLDNSFDHKKVEEIPYGDKVRVDENKKFTIPQILHQHLTEYERVKLNDVNYQWNPQEKLSDEQKRLIKEAQSEAFSEEGLESLDKKLGMKIRVVTKKEKVGIKKQVLGKWMECDGNVYFIFYENEETKERLGYASLSTYDVIQRKLEGKTIVDAKDGHKTIILQANDLVYVPTKEELESNHIDWTDKKHIAERMYRVNDFSEYTIYFQPNNFAKEILPKEVDLNYNEKEHKLQGSYSHKTASFKGKQIKETCIKLRVDRLGNIIGVNGKPL